MFRSDFAQLATLRLKEAQLLLTSRAWSGAYYLAGYSVECGLKACIAKQTRRHEFPDKKQVDRSYTHEIPTLLGLAGLAQALTQQTPMLQANWGVAKDWNENSRYAILDRGQAEGLYSAIADPADGVLQWLRQHW